MAGPFEQIPMDGGGSADLYLLRFDDQGRLRSPEAAAEVRARVQDPQDVTDVFCFAHGWNNVFAQALDRYRGFATGFVTQGAAFGIPKPAPYRPLLVGAIWPSTSFVMPWEAGPQIAADPDPFGRQAAEVEELLELVTSSLDPAEDQEFTEAVDGRRSVDAATAERLAEIAIGALRAGPDPDDGSPPPQAGDLLEAWAALDGLAHGGGAGAGGAPGSPGDGAAGDPGAAPVGFGTIGDHPHEAQPGAAGLDFDPRDLLRMATVWKMKARAGTVGAHGVGPLVEHVLTHSTARLHLIGHSFGARVVLSALTTAAAPRPAHCVLLLQPAVNRWCFAPRVAGTQRAGGFHGVLDKVTRPVLTTFSSHDAPLTRFFHLAMRGSHLGEPDFAGVGDTDLYGALGGFGPAGLTGLSVEEKAAVPGEDRYPLDGGARVIAVDGGVDINGLPAISGHGDISNPVTWWALHDLTRPD
ncbi:hypothetical protein [Streptomyces sp. NRRL S-87]|uniref:hypothetical protein n=1 Tax=Streptomyces sp. NRRL S-87 TaxID=1463920 RepID=UPI0004BFBEEE|nr:hypothetical protein [Streptomyces sp. NRRL S-87]